MPPSSCDHPEPATRRRQGIDDRRCVSPFSWSVKETPDNALHENEGIDETE
jgi:hypothetical protein